MSLIFHRFDAPTAIRKDIQEYVALSFAKRRKVSESDVHADEAFIAYVVPTKVDTRKTDFIGSASQVGYGMVVGDDEHPIAFVQVAEEDGSVRPYKLVSGKVAAVIGRTWHEATQRARRAGARDFTPCILEIPRLNVGAFWLRETGVETPSESDMFVPFSGFTEDAIGRPVVLRDFVKRVVEISRQTLAHEKAGA